MLCHQMQEENEEFKKNNPKIENNKTNDNRPRREQLHNQQINLKNQRNNDRPLNNINFQVGQKNNNNNQKRNLKRSQLKFSDWEIFDFGGLRASLNKMDNPTDEDIFEQLPESEIEDISQLSEEKKECIICLVNFKKSDKITLLPCTHMFHSYCVECWLKVKDYCPVCQIKIVKGNFGV